MPCSYYDYKYQNIPCLVTFHVIAFGALQAELVEVNSVIKPCFAECRGEEAGIEDKFCSIISPEQDGSLAGDGAPVPSNPNHSFLEQVQATLASKDNSFSQTAMRVLYRKREKLVFNFLPVTFTT